MNYEPTPGPFYRSVMAGLAGGLVSTLINLIYNFIYRDVSDYNPSQFINVTTIIFVSLLVSLVAGLAYYFIVPFAKKRNFLYWALIGVLTVLLTMLAFTSHRSDSIIVTNHFHILLGGIIVLTGLTDAFLIPYLAKNKNIAF